MMFDALSESPKVLDRVSRDVLGDRRSAMRELVDESLRTPMMMMKYGNYDDVNNYIIR